MKLSRTNISVNDNVGIRRNVNIHVGSKVSYPSGDILDANATKELIDNVADSVRAITDMAPEYLDTLKEAADSVTNVQEQIDALKKCINITYTELNSLKGLSKLVSGQWYRITDYQTTVLNNDWIQAANHQFDIIIQAISNDRFSHDAYAAIHDYSNLYFNPSGIAQWRLKYTIDNRSDLYHWASGSGHGVIYYMQDEWGNECPYDFKNIKFYRCKSICSQHTSTNFNSTGPQPSSFTAIPISSTNDSVGFILPYTRPGVSIQGDNILNRQQDYLYMYTFSKANFDNSFGNLSITDASLDGCAKNNKIRNLDIYAQDDTLGIPNAVFIARKMQSGDSRIIYGNTLEDCKHVTILAIGEVIGNTQRYISNNIIKKCEECYVMNGVENSQFVGIKKLVLGSSVNSTIINCTELSIARANRSYITNSTNLSTLQLLNTSITACDKMAIGYSEYSTFRNCNNVIFNDLSKKNRIVLVTLENVHGLRINIDYNLFLSDVCIFNIGSSTDSTIREITKPALRTLVFGTGTNTIVSIPYSNMFANATQVYPTT